MYVLRNIEARSRTHCCHGKGIIIILSYYVSVTLVIQNATRMHLIILPSVACLSLPYIHIISQTSRFSEINYWTWKLCFGFLYNFIWIISHFKKNAARYYYKRLLVFMSNSRYSCQIEWNLKFLYRFSKNIQIYRVMKIRPVEAELFHAVR